MPNKMYIVVVTKGEPSLIGSIFGREKYEYFANIAAYVASAEAARQKAIDSFGIENPDEYTITII